MIKQVTENGYNVVEFGEQSNFCVINSCSVTNLSNRKTRQALSRARKCSDIIILVGCYAQQIKDNLSEFEVLEDIDIILGNEEKKELVKYLDKYRKSEKIRDISKIIDVKKYVEKDKLNTALNIRESIKIEDGCNNYCTYCIIPYVRGRVRSRKLKNIIEEVENLVKSGVGEVILVGIEIASYGKDLKTESVNLIDVIERVSKIDGLNRIRLGSLEPRILTDENIIRMSKIPKLCKHFHISVQSLDNNVLKNMNRHYTREYLFDRIEFMKKHMPTALFTCDIIVGFPGETEEEFKNTLEGAGKIDFYEVHTFKYSKRKWTKAASFENQVDGNIKNNRSKELIKLANELKLKHMKNYIGKKVEVLIEEYKDGWLYGYTDNYIKVKVRGDEKLWGSLQIVELCSIEKDLILGKL